MKIFLVCFILTFTCFVNSTVQNCGKAQNGIETVLNGVPIHRNEYPWIAAIFLKKPNQNDKFEFVYNGGAVVISETHVLSAAHVFKPKTSHNPSNRIFHPSDFRVYLGVHDLDDISQLGREVKAVKNIHVHPHWNPDSQIFDADIAQLELENKINFNKYIQPICLWNTLNIPPTEGKIVGYGLSDPLSVTPEKTPKQRNIKIYSQEECFAEDFELAKLSSSRTFCGENGACKGDSGSGLMVYYDGSYYLRGIVSASKNQKCESFSIYTDALKFKKWIKFLKIDEDEMECGAVFSSGLIQNGFTSTREKFPWMALIEGSSRATGVLISHNHVIVAASAVRDWDNKIEKWVPKTDLRKVRVYFGKIQPNDDFSIATIPSKIDLHPDSKVYHQRDKHSTINFAVLTLKFAIEFNDFIRPVCVWNFGSDTEVIKNSPMYVVGYGNDENGKKSNIRKYTRVTLVNETDCNSAFPYSTEQDFIKKSKTFCAIGSEVGNPCHEDDVLLVKYNDVWFFRGFSIFRHVTSNIEICDIKPILFEDVAPYAKWIESIAKDF